MPKEFLGRGWKYPVELEPGDHRLAYATEEDKVQQSLLVILGTARGTRVMRPTFGSRLHELIFAPINSTTKSLMSRYVIEALVTWEPRVEVIHVDVSDEEALYGKVLINIEYRVRATNSVFNLVYPFYLREGADVGAELDRRSYGELLDTARGLAALYTPTWDGADSDDDPGAALLELFARLMELLIERLNRVPEKTFLSFLDTVGIEQSPGGSAETPITFVLPDTASSGAEIPAGSQVATTQTEATDAQVFETRSAIYATPARIERVVNVVPEADGYSELTVGALPPEPMDDSTPAITALSADAAALTSFAHVLYVEDEAIFGRPEPIDARLILKVAESDSRALFADTAVRWTRYDADAGAWVELAFAYEAGADDEVVVLFPSLSGVGLVDVDGTTGYWIAGELTAELPDAAELPRVTAIFGVRTTPAASDEAPIDAAFANAAAIDVSRPFRPFGDRPRHGDAFALSSATGLTTAVQSVTLDFTIAPYAKPELQEIFADIPDPTSITTSVRWEYLTADGSWESLGTFDHTLTADPNASDGDTGTPPAITFGSNRDQTLFGTGGAAVSLTFALAGDVGVGIVNQTEGPWLRAVLLSEEPYGADGFVVPGATTSDVPIYVGPSFVPPRVNAITLRHSHGIHLATFRRAKTMNNFLFVDQSDRLGTDSFLPYEPAASQEVGGTEAFLGAAPALHVALDRDPGNGFLSVLVHLEDTTTGASFPLESGEPQVEWEYVGAGGGWKPLDATDGTDHLTTSGVVGFAWPSDARTAKVFPELFAADEPRERFWIRGRLASGAYDEPPIVRGIYLNSVMADNQETASGDVLVGSASGEPDQQFTLVKPPVLAGALWVREPERPSEDELAELFADTQADDPDAGAIPSASDLVGDAGSAAGVWVRWLRVPNFLLAGPRSRHYTLNPVEGLVTFGDNANGLIAPIDKDNVVMRGFRRGGGATANTAGAALAVATLKTSLPFVESVFNAQAALGGADSWSLEDITRFGPQSIRSRARAVTTEDYQSMVLQNFSAVARARCLATRAPSASGELEFRSGAVTLVIVPRSTDAMPQPSKGLLRKIRDFLREHVLGNIVQEIHAIGPAYAPVRVEALATPENPEETSVVARRIEETLERFFHPLTGGEDGAGWDFGRDVPLSEIYAVLQNTQGVDHVQSVVFPDFVGQSSFVVSENSLVSSGEHLIRIA